MSEGIKRIGGVALFLVAAMMSVPHAQYPRELTHRIMMEHYKPTDKKGQDTVLAHLRMAANAGYNAVLFDGPKDLGTIEKWPQSYFDGYARVKAEAKKRNMAVVTMGISSLLGADGDPMLAEASPVRGTPFKVSGGMARCHSDHSVGLKNGNFESFSGNNPTGWKQRNLVGSLVRDGATKHGGSSSLRATKIKANAYIYQTITVKPYRAYRITAWFKTQGLSTFRDIEFRVDGKEELLNRRWVPFGTPNGKGWYTNDFRTTMNWNKCVTDFNSQNNTSVQIAFWFAKGGYGGGAQTNATIWMDDMVVEEVGLYETMRRESCPITVKSADGSKTYKEGTDYVVDPMCNKFQAPASYRYEGHLKIPAGSAIRDGEMLKVDWYKFSDNYFYCAETDFGIPETWDAMKDNYCRIDNLLGHSNWSFINFDEWRSGFQSDRYPLFPHVKTAGQYMAAALQKTVESFRSVNNTKRELWLYNDMFDPYHNAHSPYAMNVGGCANSWKGMDTSVIIINWRPGPSPADENSFAFYMGLDPLRKGIVNRQIIFCQGGDIGNRLNIVKRLEVKGGRGVIGMVWCTWYKKYGEMINAANACKAMGWWGSKPLPEPGVAVPAGGKCEVAGISAPGVVPKTGGVEMSLYSTPGGVRIEYNLSRHARVDLRMVNAKGQTVKHMTKSNQNGGETHQIHLNTRSFSSGVYFLNLQVDGKMAKQMKYMAL